MQILKEKRKRHSEYGYDRGFFYWLQENARILLSIGLVLFLLFAVYSYSKRTDQSVLVEKDNVQHSIDSEDYVKDEKSHCKGYLTIPIYNDRLNVEILDEGRTITKGDSYNLKSAGSYNHKTNTITIIKHKNYVGNIAHEATHYAAHQFSVRKVDMDKHEALAYFVGYLTQELDRVYNKCLSE